MCPHRGGYIGCVWRAGAPELLLLFQQPRCGRAGTVCRDLGLVDLWRARHPDGIVYTYSAGLRPGIKPNMRFRYCLWDINQRNSSHQGSS
jgi:hypothetical protein